MGFTKDQVSFTGKWAGWVYFDGLVVAKSWSTALKVQSSTSHYGSVQPRLHRYAQPGERAERFPGVDSANVLHNASTQIADDGEFGMGAEIGISTNKFHPCGLV